MKTWVIGGLMAATIASAGSAVAVELETQEQKLGYTIGLQFGASVTQMGEDIDLDALIDAITTSYNGGEPAMTKEEVKAVYEAFVARRQAEASAQQESAAMQNKMKGDAFLASNAQTEGVVTTDSGLQYKVITPGDGAMPSATDRVTVHYRGTLLDGTEFDSSHKRNEPITFALNQVIPGWTEGVQLMPVGSKYMFYIKPELAYGAGGGGPIPPNSTLIFEVELLEIGN